MFQAWGEPSSGYTQEPEPPEEMVPSGTEEGTVDTDAPGKEDGQAPTMIHVLKDTPPFAGEDGQTYSLKKGDMVSIPDRLAKVLVSRGMAEEVRSQG